MTRVRHAFDPDNRFNPAKLFPTPGELWRSPSAAGENSSGIVDLIYTGL